MITRNIAVVLSGRDAGLARTLGAAAGAIHAFDQSVEKANTNASKLAAGLKLGLAALAVALAVGLGASVKAAIEFETAMRNVNTVAHESEAGLKAMGQSVLQLSTELPQSANTLADGLYNIASSGFYGADALEVLEVSAKAASAGLTETDISAKAIVAVLNAYGLEASEAADVSDVLFKTVELGVLSFEDLATQLGDVVAGAALAGVEIDEVGAAIATMTLSGLSAAESTVSLNRLLRELIAPNDALQNAFRNMGYETGQAALEQDGLYGVMEKIRIATGGNVLALQTLFPEIRASRAAFALMTAGGTTYARVQAQITDETQRAGSTQAAFNEQMKAFGNQAIVFGNSIKRIGIEIGTALIPPLTQALQWMQRVGPQLGQGITMAWEAAQPALRALGRAITAVADLFQVAWKAAEPFVRTLATIAFGAAIGALQGLSNALAGVANFLIDHPAIVQAALAVWGSAMMGRILAAAATFMRLQVAAVALRVAVVSMAEVRLASFIGGLTAIARGNMAAGISNLGAAFQGLGASISKFASGAAFVGGLLLFEKALSDASDSAKKLKDEVAGNVNMDSLVSLQYTSERLKRELATLDEEWQNISGSGNQFTRTARGVVEVLSPMENSILDTAAANKELRQELERVQTRQLMWEHDIATLSNTLGISEDAVKSFLSEIEGYDPEDTATTTGMLADQIKQMALEATYATPAAAGFNEAVQTMNDPASSAADRIEALNNTMDALIGTMLAVAGTAIDFEDALDGIAEAVAEHGTNLDITSEAGREVAGSILDAADAAIAHAQAVGEETGSVKQAVDVLALHREQLIGQMQALGWSREAAEEYIGTLGLTPENVQTLVNMVGMEAAMFSVEEFNAMLGLIDGAVATGQVNLNTADFDDDAVKIGTVLAQIAMANPEATVLLNGQKFEPTAAMVEAWAMTWDSSTPEAQALLSIIDPLNNFDTLQEAAANWNGATPTAQALVDTGPANQSFRWGEEQLAAWNAARGTATVDADNNPATTNIAASRDDLHNWDASTGTSDVNANNSGAMTDIGAARGELWGWESSSGTADVYVNDQASGTLSWVDRLLAEIDGTIARASVHVAYSSYGDIPGAAAALRGTGRYGWIDERMARGGVLQAGMVREPTVLFGERETGGEAFVPRRGNPNRSLAILAQAASWYGAEIVPRGSATVSSGGWTFAPAISVNVNANTAADKSALARLISRQVGDEMARNTADLIRFIKAR